MVVAADILRVARRIAEAIRAERVILFGSHARGEAREDSDVDLLIVAPSSLPRFKRSRELYRLFKPYPFPMDLIVYTPEEVRQALRLPASFVATVMREGQVLYERES
jgi:predicted nucleotidyltransferase